MMQVIDVDRKKRNSERWEVYLVNKRSENIKQQSTIHIIYVHDILRVQLMIHQRKQQSTIQYDHTCTWHVYASDHAFRIHTI